ncbi:PIN domain-containing protein [Sinorhizobium fredii]|uniref:PIN domain-containing protein n=1 Tax=Rhizobium fredii TaxID=380 RepID=A0A2A6M6U2_RHIFR|nr:PIN domain-containing protein [Sinorhizobium fredii]PDT50156.1 PIN domain-containing protein [Sinorhizobium fredii]
MLLDIFLLDTNVISNAQKKKPHPTLAAWLDRQSKVAIPFPVIVEIEQGIREVSISNPEKASELRAWIDDILESDILYPDITPQVAQHLAALQCCRPLKNLWRIDPNARKQKSGQDLFIAAVSLAYELPIATMDRDFVVIHRYFPLPGLYDPIRDEWLVHPEFGDAAYSEQPSNAA